MPRTSPLSECITETTNYDSLLYYSSTKSAHSSGAHGLTHLQVRTGFLFSFTSSAVIAFIYCSIALLTSEHLFSVCLPRDRFPAVCPDARKTQCPMCQPGHRFGLQIFWLNAKVLARAYQIVSINNAFPSRFLDEHFFLWPSLQWNQVFQTVFFITIIK